LAGLSAGGDGFLIFVMKSDHLPMATNSCLIRKVYSKVKNRSMKIVNPAMPWTVSSLFPQSLLPWFSRPHIPRLSRNSNFSAFLVWREQRPLL